MATTIGEATIKLTFDNKELDKSADKAESKVNSFLGKVGTTAKIGGKFLAGAFAAATTGVIALSKASIGAYADFEQMEGGVRAMFGDSADTIMKYAQDAYKTAGLSATEYLQQATSFSSRLIRDTGGDMAKVAELTDRAIKDMSDNANRFGTDIESIQHAYEGLSKGNATMLDNLKIGYGGTQTELLKLVKDMGIVDESVKSFNDISFEDAINAIHEVQERLEITGTTAEEAGTTISGAFNMAKKSLQNLITGLADPNADLGKLMDDVVNSIVGTDDKNKGVLGVLEPAIERTLTSIAIIIEKGVPKLAEMLPGLLEKTLPGIATAAVAVITAITKVLPTLAPVLADGLSVLIKELVPYLPEIIGSLVQALVTFFIEGWKHTFEMYGEFLAPVIDKITTTFTTAINFIQKILLSMVVWAYRNVINPIRDFFNGLWNGIKTGVQAMANAVRNIFSTIVGFIKAPINAIIDGVNKILGKINGIKIPDWVPGVGGAHTSFATLPKLAQGGIATRATGAMIGEAGTEAVIPLERNTGNWAGLLASAIRDEFESEEMTIGGGMTVYMTNNINNNLDADEIGQRLMTSIRRAA